MNMEKIKKVIQLLEKHGLSKISIKDDKEEICIEKTVAASPVHPIVPAVLEENKEASSNKEKGKFIESPMVGTFYSSPAPDQSSLVKVGDKVEKDTIVCIIEAMKVMNEIKADFSGVIEDILVENGDPVEFGQKMLKIRKK